MKVTSLLFNLQINWTAVSAIAAIVTAIAAGFGVIGIYIAVRQLTFQAWVEAQRVFTRSEFVDLRMWVIEKNGDWKTPEDKEKAKDACRKLDEFARLAPFLAPFFGMKFALRIWADPIAKCWRSLESIVNEERRETRFYDKWEAFETLGRQAVVQAGLKSKRRRLGG